MKLKYETFKKSPIKFSTFLLKCQQAINKLYGFECEIDADFWSTKNNPHNNDTYWDILKKEGQLFINNSWHAISFDFNSIIYADYPSFQYKKGGCAIYHN